MHFSLDADSGNAPGFLEWRAGFYFSIDFVSGSSHDSPPV